MSTTEAHRARHHAGAPTGLDAQPGDDYFDVMASVASTHWWYRARRSLVSQLLVGRIRPGCVALDVGCGTSETLDVLESLGAGAAVGTDLSKHALEFAVTRRPRPRVLRALAEAIPVRDGAAGAVVSMDVVEHLDDDVVAMEEYVRILEPGAPVVLSVPAYEWLWSVHDDRAFHRRRYDAASLARSARDAGLVVERVTYCFSFLLPVAVLLRKTPLRRFFPVTDEEVSSGHRSVDALLGFLARVERAVMRRVRIPFGLSVVLVGRAPEAPAAT